MRGGGAKAPPAPPSARSLSVLDSLQYCYLFLLLQNISVISVTFYIDKNVGHLKQVFHQYLNTEFYL